MLPVYDYRDVSDNENFFRRIGWCCEGVEGELLSLRRYAGGLEDEVAGVRRFPEFVQKGAPAEAMGFAISLELRVVEDGVVVYAVFPSELLQNYDEVGVGGDGLGSVDVDGVAGAPKPEGGGLIEKDVSGEVREDG
jgi:hypothetical protein